MTEAIGRLARGVSMFVQAITVVGVCVEEGSLHFAGVVSDEAADMDVGAGRGEDFPGEVDGAQGEGLDDLAVAAASEPAEDVSADDIAEGVGVLDVVDDAWG